MNQAQLKQQASIAVMKSAMDVAEGNNNALLDMLNSVPTPEVPHPHAGNIIDIKA